MLTGGFLHCRIRRVKCDENKPQCLRCQKFGHQCDGYVKHASKPPQWNNSSSRTLVPKASSSAGASSKIPPISTGRGGNESASTNTMSQTISNPEPSSNSWASPSSSGGTGARTSLSPSFANLYTSTTSTKQYPSLPPIYDRPVFQNPSDRHAFHNFCAQTQPPASSTSLPIPAHTWTDLISDACSSSSDIMTAVLTLGSMSLGRGSGERGGDGTYVAVGTLSHYKAWRGGGHSISRPADWTDRAGDSRKRTPHENPAVSPLRSESDSDPESPGYRERDVSRSAAVGLKKLSEWAYNRQRQEQERGRQGWDDTGVLLRHLVRSLEMKGGLCRLPPRERNREWGRERYRRESSGEDV